MSDRVGFVCNGAPVEVDVAPGESLLSVLRERLGLVSAKDGCAPQGQCGCCTVLVDGTAVSGCLYLAAFIDGAEVTTVEHLAKGDRLSPVQEAFIEAGAFQCGYCTPGFVNQAQVLVESLARAPVPKAEVEARILAAMDGHICRCTGYVRYYAALRDLILADPKLTR